MIRDHIKHNPLIAISYVLIFAIFGGTMYFVQQQNVTTERRTRATNAVSCDYTINIVSPTPTQIPAATATQTETPTPTQVAVVDPAATPTIPDVVCTRRASISIIIDRSGSMSNIDSNGKSKLELARDAAKAFVTAIKESNSHNITVSVVSFGGQGNDGSGSQSREYDSTLHIGASSDYDAVLSAIGGIAKIKSGTCIQCGVRIANGQVASSGDTKAVILLSDGQANHVWSGGTSGAKQAVIAEANDGRTKGITYYVMGFGDKAKGQIDETTLQSIAGSSGQYMYKPDASTWTRGFFELLPNFCTPVGQ